MTTSISMANLNWVDYVILIIFLFTILSGFSRGLVKEIISLISLIAAFIIASIFASPLATMFTHTSTVQNALDHASAAAATPVSYAAIGLCFAALFVGTLLVGFIIGSVLNMALSTGVLGVGNRILGGAFGLIKGFAINLVLIFVVQLTALGDQTFWHNSQLVNVYQPAVQWLANYVSPSLANLKDKFNDVIQDGKSAVTNMSTPNH